MWVLWSSSDDDQTGPATSIGSHVAATAAALEDVFRSRIPTDDDLLLAFRVAQELHEYAYSIQHLPHWRYVADAALPALIAFR